MENTICFLKNADNEKSIIIDSLIEKIKVIEEKLADKSNAVPTVTEPPAPVNKIVKNSYIHVNTVISLRLARKVLKST